MRLTRRLALLAALALALLAVLATGAFATSPGVDATETATVITNNGADITNTGALTNTYEASSTAVTLTSGAGTSITCASDSTFTIDVTGDGAITNLEFHTCNNGCAVNDVDTSTHTTTPVTITNGGFTVTGNTVDTTNATFLLDGTPNTGTATNTGIAEITGTVSCTEVDLNCRFTTPTGTTAATTGGLTNRTGTVPFTATIDEGTPGHLTFLNSTVDGDTAVVCPDSDMTGTYTIDDPTAAGAEDLTVSP